MARTADVAPSRQDKEPWGPTLRLSEGPRGDQARVLARHSKSGSIWNLIPAAGSADPLPLEYNPPISPDCTLSP